MEQIKTVLKKVGSITLHEREQMLSLVQAYYDNLSEEAFLNNLTRKDFVVFLKDRELIIGFTAIELSNYIFEGQQIRVVLAEETVISREYWQNQELPLLWLQSIFELREQDKTNRWYWIVPASSYLSYQSMTLFFPEFYPRYNRAMPPKIKQLVRDFGQWKFKGDFNPAKGVVAFKDLGAYLTKELRDIPLEKLEDANVRYFISKNPLYHHGDHLVCLAEIHRENVTPFGEAVLRQKKNKA